MKQLLIKIDENLKKTLKKYCIDNDITMNDYIINLIKESMKNE